MTTAPAPAQLVRTELRLHRRHGVLLATAVMTAVWAGVLLTLPASWRPLALPWVLFLDLATLGLFFAPALAVTERGNGVTTALRLTRLSPARALSVRVGLLNLAALAAAAVVVPVAGLRWSPVVLGGVVLTSTLLSLLALVLVGRADTLTTYIARVPAVGVALILPALVHGTGLSDAAWLALSPATGALGLLAGRWSWAAAAWILLWVVGLALVAARLGFDVRPGLAPVYRRRAATPIPGTGRWAAVRSFARADRRTLLGERMLVLLVAGVPVLALLVRWLGGPGLEWFEGRYGHDLSAHLPLFWALALVLHTPTMFGAVAGLLFLEDRDAGLLPAIAVTRASVRTLLAYRLGVTAAVTAFGVLAGLAITGAEHPAGGGGVIATAVVAGVVATVPALLLATVVRDRVQGMALMKAMGLPLYLPLAWWFVDAPAGWLFALAPTGWVVRAFWAPSLPAVLLYAAGGIAFSLLLHRLLLPRLRRSLVG